MKKTAVLAIVSSMLLSACGGGGSSTDASKVATPSKLAAYTGHWAGVCQVDSIESFDIIDTPGVQDGITNTVTQDYFAQSGCTGAVIATGKYSTNFTVTYAGSANAGVIFTAGSPSVMSKIDLVLSAQPGSVYTVTGANVVHTTTSDGMDQWCMGNGFCTTGQGTVAAGAPVSGGLYFSGNTMYVLAPSGSEYKVTESYTKK
jgi:hypothetical protein